MDRDLQTAATQGDIRAIKKEVELVSEKVNEVHLALIGSHLTKDGGMVRRLIDCEKDVEEIKVMIDKIEQNNIKSNFYIRIIWGCGGALIMSIGSLIINHFFNK